MKDENEIVRNEEVESVFISNSFVGIERHSLMKFP